MLRAVFSMTSCWPLSNPFRISRGEKTIQSVVVVRIREGEHLGRGECVPYARYDESTESVLESIESVRPALEEGIGREELLRLLPSGAARNAIDAALWDLECKRRGKRAWEVANMGVPSELGTSFTLTIDEPERLYKQATRLAAQYPHRLTSLKLKVDGHDDLACVEAVHAALPSTKLIVDANEGWSVSHYRQITPRLAEYGVVAIEQPFAADDDEILETLPRPIPVCADESFHDGDQLKIVKKRYDMVNIKLDKTGGLTAALALVQEVKRAGLKLMVGCMTSTSLSIAPAWVVAQYADLVDLDGHLLLARDRKPSMPTDGLTLKAPPPELWG